MFIITRPYVLEVAKNYQHGMTTSGLFSSSFITATLNNIISPYTVNPRPRRIPMTVINKTLNSRLHSFVKRVRCLTQSTVSNTKTAPLNIKEIPFQTTSMTKCCLLLFQIERLEELFPQIKLKRRERMTKVHV